VLCNHKETTADPEKSKLGIYTVATSPFMRWVKKERLKVYTVTLHEINQALGKKDVQEKPFDEVIPKEYH
jgi:hypothetical protein